jgi:Tfp pilus assembly protein PilZ
MQDKRRHKRFTLNVADVNARMVLVTEVNVIDISIGGILIKANRRLNIGSEYTLKLGAKDRVISLRGAVIWSSLSESRARADGEVMPLYRAGLKFKNMSAESIAELLNFIEGHKKEEVHAAGKDRLNVRFHIDDAEKAILNFPAVCEAKVISLGGVMIECIHDFEIGSTIPMSLSIHDDKLIRFMGRVASRRVIYSDGRKQYAIGIEFLDLTDKDREILATFVDRCPGIEENGEGKKDANRASYESLPVISKELIDRVEHLYKWHKTMGYYKLLCVKEWASEEQIKRAFHTMAREFHPDRHPGISQDLKEKMNVIFAYANEAYSTLMNPQKRKEYDRIPISRIRH